MKRSKVTWKLLLILVVLAALAVAVLLYYWIFNHRGVSKEDFEKLELGMSKEEVVSILGEPWDIDNRDSVYETWSFYVPSIVSTMPYCYFDKKSNKLVRIRWDEVVPQKIARDSAL
jgi:hypothetical protein